MAYVNLEMAKKHLNLDDYITDDDSYINQLIEVAEAVVSKDVCESLEELAKANEGNLPSPLSHAILLLVGGYYANREPVAYAQLKSAPLSYEHLISLYRDYHK